MITWGYDRMSRPTSIDCSDSRPTPRVRTTSPDGSYTITDGPGTVDYSFDDAGDITARTYPERGVPDRRTWADEGGSDRKRTRLSSSLR